MDSENKKVRLVDVDTDNFDDLIDLSVTEEQKKYVASNIYSLAEAYATNAEGHFAKPFGIYVGDTPVGFIMIGYFYNSGKHHDGCIDAGKACNKGFALGFVLSCAFH